MYNNQIIDIVGVEAPKKNYIVLESLSNETEKVFHIINTEQLIPQGSSKRPPGGKDFIKIGRA